MLVCVRVLGNIFRAANTNRNNNRNRKEIDKVESTTADTMNENDRNPIRRNAITLRATDNWLILTTALLMTCKHRF